MGHSLKLLFCLFIKFCMTGKSEASTQLMCTISNGTIECPANSVCNAVNSTAKSYQCDCLPNYIWNPLWQQNNTNNNVSTDINNNNNTSYKNTTNNDSNNSNNMTRNNFNSSVIGNATAYCIMAGANETESGKVKVYVQQPAKVEHLAFGILMVLFVAIALIVALYLLKVLRPIKRTRAVYTQLKRRRENRERLEEFSDDICMIQLK